MSDKYLIYIGKGSLLRGVPTRDLTYDEVKENNFDAVHLIAIGLYKYASEENIPAELDKDLKVKKAPKKAPSKKRSVKHG